jgi:XTP/dITP diphosphohydrolase
MQKVVIATHNPSKIAELTPLLSDLPLQFVTLDDVGITEDAVEDGMTYESNSQKKALFYSQLANLPAISDDGGLEIFALNNQPGVHSRRWLGPDTTDEDLIAHMIQVAKELPDDNRGAKFTAVLSLALPDGNVWSVDGSVDGIIAKKPSIHKMIGFPYRSFFFLPELNKYYFESELTPEEQKLYNHRVKAVQKLKKILRKELHLA